jgi:glucose-1-phosphate adenylyltransferase
MNYGSMLEYHKEMNADLTVGALRVDPEAARQFGVMEVDENQRILGFEEKVANPKTIPGEPGFCLGSMGIYVFTARFLFEQLCKDATRSESAHDFGHNIIPSIIDTHRVYAFPFRDENRKRDAYWRDVGTLDAYYDANMDLVSVDPELNLYDEEWPIRTYQHNYPPPKFVFGSTGELERQGRALDSIACQGSIVSGGQVEHSILGPKVRVNSWAHVQDSILFEGVNIGRRARVRRAIIDKGVKIPPGVEIGFDVERDRQRGFTITERGIVVIAKADGVEQMLTSERVA